MAPGFYFNIGIDVVEVDFWRVRLPQLKHGVEQKLFYAEEHAYFQSYPNPEEYYAGGWAAKEAIYKAISSLGKLDLRQIKIIHQQDQAPLCSIENSLLQSISPFIRLSISHNSLIATAQAAILLPSDHPIANRQPFM